MRATILTLLMVALPSLLVAQDAGIEVGGRVIGPDATPLPGQEVVLHRVDLTGGATIAETVSADDGSFSMTAGSSSDTSAVYFVAARHDGELYIGAPFKPGSPGTLEQEIQVGVPGMSASAMLGQAPEGGVAMPATGRPATSRNWLLLVVPLLGVAAVALFMMIPRSSIPEQRALLIRIAELDERAASSAGSDTDGLIAERSELMTRLRSG